MLKYPRIKSYYHLSCISNGVVVKIKWLKEAKNQQQLINVVEISAKSEEKPSIQVARLVPRIGSAGNSHLTNCCIFMYFICTELLKYQRTTISFEISHIYVNDVRLYHDDVKKWKHFPRYWPFVRGSHRSPVNSTDKGQWRTALMFSLICTWTKAE